MPHKVLSLSDQRKVKPRNIVLQDYYGCVLAGFYQYGAVTWTTFFQWLSLFVDTSEFWIIVRGDRYGAEQYLPSNAIIMPGKYVLLGADGSPLHVNLKPTRARRRQLTPVRADSEQRNFARVAERDNTCMIYGQNLLWNRLQVAHIFPRGHGSEWNDSGFPSLITDGGHPKIESIQNLLLLSAELHISWADHDFGVNPDDGYRVTAFVAGLDDIVGRVLHLDHISDPTTRPLDQLLRDHFQQGLFKHVKGSGETRWNYSQTFGIGTFDLSDNVVWGTEEGKERLELELENRLFEHRLRQDMRT